MILIGVIKGDARSLKKKSHLMRFPEGAHGEISEAAHELGSLGRVRV